MKKLLTLILVLVGYVGSVSAKTITIYVNADAAPCLHAWDSKGNLNGSWGAGQVLSESKTINGVLFYYKELETEDDNISFLFHNGNGQQTGDIKDISSDSYYHYNGTTSYETYTIPSVTIQGQWNPSSDWASESLTRSGDTFTYTGTIDLSDRVLNSTFKLVISNPVTTGSSYGWLGNGSVDVSGAPSGWIGGETSGSYNMILNTLATGYKTIHVTASWTPSTDNCTGWTLTLSGEDTRASQTYTLSFINNLGWSNINCYAFDDNDAAQANWPGMAMETTNVKVSIAGTSYTKYTKTFTFYEPYPTKVVFNNGDSGSGNQTGDLGFVNNTTYSAPVYYVVGSADAFGNWVHNNTTAVMADDGDGTYSLSVNDAVLSSDFDYKVIKKSYYGYEGDPEGWYPYNNASFATVTENGKYDLVFYFDPSAEMSSTASVEGSTATLKSIPATTVGGYGTFSSATHDLDFSSASLTAYTATSAADGLVHMEPVTGKVPAATGLFLVGATEYIPVTTDASSVGTNLLHPTTGGDIYNSSKFQYVLGNQSGIAFYKVGGSLSPAAGKAYLETDAAAATNARLAFIFDDDENTTGIVNNKREVTAIDGYYNLNGQRVANPTKGLYIVNGKKVIIK